MNNMHENISKIPLSYSKGMYQGELFGISKTEFNNGKSIKYMQNRSQEITLSALTII